MIIPLTQSTDDLPDALYDSILGDDTEGDLFFDNLEDVDSSLDAYVDIGDYTFSVKDPSTPFSFPTKGTADDYGEHIYWDNVCYLDTPDEFWSDNALVCEDNFFMKYVCDLWIHLWQYESNHQHQNYPKNIR